MESNKLMALNNHLFEQLERLNDDELTEEEIRKETERTSAIVRISSQIINTASVALKAEKLKSEISGSEFNKPEMIE